MSAIDELFKNLKAENKKAFMPFITAGDPDLHMTAHLLRTLDATGCQSVLHSGVGQRQQIGKHLRDDQAIDARDFDACGVDGQLRDYLPLGVR